MRPTISLHDEVGRCLLRGGTGAAGWIDKNVISCEPKALASGASARVRMLTVLSAPAASAVGSVFTNPAAGCPTAILFQSIPRRGKARAAFTLLELVLTLAMSVVFMALIGGAIDFYGRHMNIRNLDVRQSRLAVALLQMIEDDLRATLHGEPNDLTALNSLLLVATGQPAESTEDLSAAGIESTEEMSSMTDELGTDLTTSASVLETPGLIGSQTSIQVDLSRLPRLEEYQPMEDATTGDLEEMPSDLKTSDLKTSDLKTSDLKTVAYFVQHPSTIGGIQDPLQVQRHSFDDSAQVGGGLVRRSLDRSASVYAVSTGGVTMLNQSGELLAPEVTAIEFEYWDGSQWLPSWSSDRYGELPMAVRIQLSMKDATSIEEAPVRVFSHVVRLPMSRRVDESPKEGESKEAGI